MLKELRETGDAQQGDTADNILVFLYRLRDQYRPARSKAGSIASPSIGFFSDIIYQLESRPDAALKSDEWRSRLEDLLRDIAEETLVFAGTSPTASQLDRRTVNSMSLDAAKGTMQITIDQIRNFFNGFQRTELGRADLKRAAVLVLFYPGKEGLHVLLTKRTEDVEHHKGQISFPGGVCDDVDKHIVETALRECEEEVGLSRSAVDVLGIFNEYETPSGFAITPVIAWVPELPRLNPSAAEVAQILEVPVALFLDKRNERVERRRRMGRELDVYFYRFGEHEIWGATASILRAFLHCLTE